MHILMYLSKILKFEHIIIFQIDKIMYDIKTTFFQKVSVTSCYFTVPYMSIILEIRIFSVCVDLAYCRTNLRKFSLRF